jgi:hypothetical protein
VVFDLDNTVADTRFRTLALLELFARKRLALPLSDVTLHPRSTAEKAGFAPKRAAAFADFWYGPHGFWSASAFRHDVPILETRLLAQQSHRLGFELRYLSGRVAALSKTSSAWLADHSFPSSDNVILKPDTTHRTAQFKSTLLRQWSDRQPVAFFATEEEPDIAAVQREVPQVPCLLVAFPLRNRAELKKNTAVIEVPSTHVTLR